MCRRTRFGQNKLKITIQYSDYDGDGTTDAELGFFFNDKLYENQYIYISNYGSNTNLGNCIGLENKTAEIMVRSTPEMDELSYKLYDLADKTYTAVETDFPNVASVYSGDTIVDFSKGLDTPGDYIVKDADGNAIGQVILYKSGDVHSDGNIDVRDLVAMKKVQQGVAVSTWSGIMGAYEADFEDTLIIDSLLGIGVSKYLDFVVDVETGRDIRILQLTDTQIIDPGQKRYETRIARSESITEEEMYNTCFAYIEDAIEKTNPDLILLTGDIVYGEFDDDGHIFQAVVNYMDSFGIPWAPIYGNHDNESQKGVTWQNEQFMQASNCLFKPGDVTGNGNYTLGITQGGELVKVIYMMDSNGCSKAYTYSYTVDGVTTTLNYNENESVKTASGLASDQKEWLSYRASAIFAATDGDVSSMIAFHYPIAQFAYGAYEAGYQSDDSLTNDEVYQIGVDVIAQEGDSGYKGAVFKGIYEDARLWSVLKTNHFDGVFCGHSHENSVSVQYDGIRLTFGLKTGTQERYVEGHTGGTLISMKSDGSFTVTHQYYQGE